MWGSAFNISDLAKKAQELQEQATEAASSISVRLLVRVFGLFSSPFFLLPPSTGNVVSPPASLFLPRQLALPRFQKNTFRTTNSTRTRAACSIWTRYDRRLARRKRSRNNIMMELRSNNKRQKSCIVTRQHRQLLLLRKRRHRPISSRHLNPSRR